MASASDHFDGRRFFNPGAPAGKSFWEVPKWKLADPGKPWPRRVDGDRRHELLEFVTLVTFQALQVGHSLALFQTSAILSAVLSYGLFQERRFRRRLIGSTVMVVGAVLIVGSR